MKRIKSILMPCLISASMITLTSCNDSNEEWMQNNADNVLKIETSIVDTRAVVTGTEFKEGDKIGIYAQTSDGHEYTGNSSNVCAMYGRQWGLLTDITLRKEEATIYAYYPYNASTVNTNDSINIDISPVKGDQPDYMYGSFTGVNQEQTTAKIAFKHALARVTLAITKSPTDVGEGKISNIRIENDTLYSVNKTNNGIVLEKIGKGTELSVKGKMSLKDGGIRNTLEQNACIEQSINRTINEKEKEYIDFLVMPCGQPIHVMPSNRKGGEVCAIITIDGSEYKVKLDFPYWEAGKQYTYPVNINRKTNHTKAQIGDYYYSDGTWSSEFNKDKKCIGIVFALSKEQDSDIDITLNHSNHGRIVSLQDVGKCVWGPSRDYSMDLFGNRIIDCIRLDGKNDSGYLPIDGKEKYYYGKGGLPYNFDTWIDYSSDGQSTDFALAHYVGKHDSGILASSASSTNKAAAKCQGLNTENDIIEWYLPSIGELSRLGMAYGTGLLNKEQFSTFGKNTYWSSSTRFAFYAWTYTFANGYIKDYSRSKEYYVRPVASF